MPALDVSTTLAPPSPSDLSLSLSPTHTPTQPPILLPFPPALLLPQLVNSRRDITEQIRRTDYLLFLPSSPAPFSFHSISLSLFHSPSHFLSAASTFSCPFGSQTRNKVAVDRPGSGRFAAVPASRRYKEQAGKGGTWGQERRARGEQGKGEKRTRGGDPIVAPVLRPAWPFLLPPSSRRPLFFVRKLALRAFVLPAPALFSPLPLVPLPPVSPSRGGN